MTHRQEVINRYLSKPFNTHPKLSNINHFKILENCVRNVYGRNTVLFCIDVEAFEFDSKKITEIGISIFDPSYQAEAIVPSMLTFHIRPEENKHLKNGRFVPDNATYFGGIATHIMQMDDIVTFLGFLVEKYFKKHTLPCCLVGHDLKGDVKWLRSLGINFPEDCLTLDTQLLLSFSTQQKRSLAKCLRILDIQHAHLHNAGNDAYYTLLLALKASDPQARVMYNLDSLYPVPVDKVKLKAGQCLQVTPDSFEHLIEQAERGYNFDSAVYEALVKPEPTEEIQSTETDQKDKV